MTPACIACGAPVKPKVTRTPSTLGERIIDGIRWCWFCSRQCSCRQQGIRAAKEGRVQWNCSKMRDMRLQQAVALRRSLYAEDVRSLRRYGVPPSLTLAILERAHQRGDRSGYNRAHYKFGRKEAAA